MTRTCECGRPALSLVRYGHKRNRASQRGEPTSMKAHDLCQQCWDGLVQQAAQANTKWRGHNRGRGAPLPGEE